MLTIILINGTAFDNKHCHLLLLINVIILIIITIPNNNINNNDYYYNLRICRKTFTEQVTAQRLPHIYYNT